MADEDITLSISAVLDGGSIDELTKQLMSGVAEATTEGGKRAQKQYAEYVTSAIEAGIRDVDDTLAEDVIKGMTDRAEEAQKKIVEAWEKGDKEHAKFLERERIKETKHNNALAKRRKDSYESLAQKQDKDSVERAEMFSDRMKGGMAGIFGASGVAGLLKNLGAAKREKGEAAIHRGRMANASAEERAAGVKGEAGAAKGAEMMKLGAAIGAIGGIAMMVVALVKAFIDLDSKVKDMNKSFAETATSADFGFGTAREAGVGLTKTMDTIRGQILKQAVDWEGYRQSSESMFKVLGAMNEMNLTFKEMDRQIKDNTNTIKSFADVSIRAVAYGKLMGVDMNTMGQNLAKMSNEWGVGLDEISKGLHMVHKESLLSGFSTKRFYSTILEVTSGLGQYNVRLTEASQLLTAFEAARGTERGAKGFQEAAGQNFGSKSAVDVLKDVLLKGGPGAVKDIFTDEARAKAGDLFKALNDSLDKSQVEALGKKFKLDTSSATAFGASFAKNINTAQKRDEFQSAMAKAGASGVALDFGQEAGGLAAAGAGKGDVNRMAESIGDLGAASRMRMMMRLPVMFNDVATTFGEFVKVASVEEMEAMQGTIGMTREQMVDFGRGVDNMEKQLEGMMAQQADANTGLITTRQGTFQDLGGGEYQRVSRDKDTGEITKMGASFKNLDGYLAAMNDAIEQDNKVINEDLEMAKRNAEATESLNTVMQESVAAILEKIYTTLRDIWYWMKGDATKRRMLETSRATFKGNLKRWERENEKELAAAQKQLGKAKTPEDIEAAKGRVSNATQRTAMTQNLAQVAPDIDPTAYGSYGAYEDAIFAASNVDRDKFGATRAGPPPPQQVPGGREKRQKNQADVADKMRNVVPGADFAILDDGISETLEDIKEVYDANIIEGSTGVALQNYQNLWKYSAAMFRQYPHPDGRVPGTVSLADGAGRMITEIENALKHNDFSRYADEFPGWTTEKANDMYVPTNGRPISLNSSDEILAMKPGGALAQALGGAGGGKGGSPVTINVRGGNPREVMDAVIKGINIANGKPFA